MSAAAPSRRDRIRSELADLKMPGSLEALDQVLSHIDGGKLGAAEVIESLLGAQISPRDNRRPQAAMRSSRLPAVKLLSDFDFSFQLSIRREQLDSLSRAWLPRPRWPPQSPPLVAGSKSPT